MVPVMLEQDSSRLVGMVGGHFQWGTFINRLIPNRVSDIDMVLRSKGDVLTFRIEEGQAIFQSVGDTQRLRHLHIGVLPAAGVF
jgi:hypothetical protein